MVSRRTHTSIEAARETVDLLPLLPPSGYSNFLKNGTLDLSETSASQRKEYNLATILAKEIGELALWWTHEPQLAVGDGSVDKFAGSREPLVDRWLSAEQFGYLWISAFRTILLSHVKAKIRDAFPVRHIDEKRPEPLLRVYSYLYHRVNR